MVEILRASVLGLDNLGSMDLLETAAVQLAEVKISSQHSQQGKEHSGVSKGAYRGPRRAFSSNEYHIPVGPVTSSQLRIAASVASPSHTTQTDSYFTLRVPTPLTPIPASPTEPDQVAQVSRSVSPAWGAASPMRSFSVMDYEPVPVIMQPGERLQLIHLPPEIHFAIFDFLDPIDSTCLGLTSKHFYAIHMRMHGVVPLSARREGPNDMEWAWRGAGRLLDALSGLTRKEKERALEKLVPRGQVFCRKCLISRCELHKHIADFFPEDYEYCDIRQKFGPKAPTGARPTCCRASPKHPRRCGRHTRPQRAVRLV